MKDTESQKSRDPSGVARTAIISGSKEMYDLQGVVYTWSDCNQSVPHVVQNEAEAMGFKSNVGFAGTGQQ
jgi:hypothetical protein